MTQIDHKIIGACTELSKCRGSPGDIASQHRVLLVPLQSLQQETDLKFADLMSLMDTYHALAQNVSTLPE
jgi:hypothetical protein